MDMFREGLNSFPVQNDHHDEILEISSDDDESDSEHLSATSSTGDNSPSKVSFATF